MPSNLVIKLVSDELVSVFLKIANYLRVVFM